MNWLEVAVSADAEAAEAISELFHRYGTGGAVIEQYPGDARDPGVPGEPGIVVKTYLDVADSVSRRKVEEGLWHLSQIYPFGEPEFRVLEEEDWATAWRKDYTVQHIGQRIVVVPSWLEYAEKPGEQVLSIDPGMAFGTGLHPSTRLCLTALESTSPAGKSLLDVGTGSGILAIYAAKSGAGPIVALEIDPVAVKVAEENLRINAIKDRVALACGSLAASGYDLAQGGVGDLYPGPFDLIAINILAEVIAELTPALVAHLAGGGRVVAAGIIQEREALVKGAWSEAGLEVVQRCQDGDWVSLIGARVMLA